MRYLLDEDLSTDVARIGRRLGIDVWSVHEIDREGWTDEEQLAQAAIDERCMVTGNRDDFRNLTNEFFVFGRPHCGVLIVQRALRNADPAAIARALAAFDGARGQFPSDYLCDYLHPAEHYRP
jgi:predicted nuclease of predicted toxin-antitoxin system